MKDSVSQGDRMQQVRARLETAREIIRRDTTLVGNHLTIRLTFVDEEQIAEMWLECVADIQWLLEEVVDE